MPTSRRGGQLVRPCRDAGISPAILAEAGNHVGPQPPGTWTPAFAPPPVIPAEAGNHVGPLPVDSGSWTVVSPQPPGTWTPAFAGETEAGCRSTTEIAEAWRGRGPRLSPPHPSFRRKPETTSAPYQWTVVSPPTPGDVDPGFRRGDGVGSPTRHSRPHPSFRRKPETTSALNPQGRGPRLSPPPPSFRRKPETTSAPY